MSIPSPFFEIPQELLTVPPGTSSEIAQIVLDIRDQYRIRQRQEQREALIQFEEAISVPDEPIEAPSAAAATAPHGEEISAPSPISASLLYMHTELPVRPVRHSFGLFRRKNQSGQLEECLACATEFDAKKLLTMPCGHKYCVNCFDQLVSNSLEEVSFPPKCCGKPVDRKMVASRVSRTVRKSYNAMEQIMSISLENRWYCPYPRCGKVHNKDFNKMWMSDYQRFRCPSCFLPVCLRCNRRADRKHICRDEDGEAVQKEAKRCGWKSCKKCGHIIELTSGCRHVTCKCRYQFCWICDLPWGNCGNSFSCYQKHEEFRAKVRQDEAAAAAVGGGGGGWNAPQAQQENHVPAVQVDVVEDENLAEDIMIIARMELEEEQRMEQVRAERRRVQATQFEHFREQLEELRRYQEALVRSRYEYRRGMRPGLAAVPALQLLTWMSIERQRQLDEDEELFANSELDIRHYRENAHSLPEVIEMLNQPSRFSFDDFSDIANQASGSNPVQNITRRPVAVSG